ncbi:MAG TPA: response regulator [Gammaproteobacteria bacterium]|nr:response regulator [Gammaproteobacteria bacterium]
MATILIVEDDTNIRTLITEFLTLNHHHIIEAKDGASGLTQYQLHCREIDLVITDIVMPGTEGVELILELKRIDPSIPILAISGADVRIPVSHLSTAKALGADATLKKPFSFSTLKNKVDKLTTINKYRLRQLSNTKNHSTPLK